MDQIAGAIGGAANAVGGAFAPPPQGWQPTADQPGYGVPGMPPNQSFLGAVGDAGRAVGGAFSNSFGAPAQASSPGPTDFDPQQSPGSPDLQNALNQAAAKEQLRQMLWQMLIGQQVQPQQAPFTRNDQSAPAEPPPPPYGSPMGTYR